jgi:uncharacterized protein YwgA
MPGRACGIVAWIMRVAGIRAAELKSREGLEARVRVQKLVFLMRRFIPALRGYKFSLYIYGPYSPGLARAYYELAERGDGYIAELASTYEPPKGVERILRELARLDTETLELMATAYDIYSAHKGSRLWEPLRSEFLIKRVLLVKPWASRKAVERAIDELARLGFIEVAP